MTRVILEEKQKLPGAIAWIAVFAGVAGCAPLFWGIYVRMALHEPWGDADMSDTGLILLLVLLLAAAVLMFWIISHVHLHVIIDQEGISYRYFPHHWKMQRVDKNSIAGYQVRKLQWNELLHRRTRHFRRPHANEKFIIGGNMALELTLPAGKTITLGTREPESVTWAMKKLMTDQ